MFLDDDVIEGVHIYKCQGIFEPFRDLLIRTAWFCDTGGVIMAVMCLVLLCALDG